MKRSAAVEIIKGLLEGYEDPGFEEEREDDADALLAALERIGMKPPQNGSEYEGYGSGDDYMCVSTPSYKWDKE